MEITNLNLLTKELLFQRMISNVFYCMFNKSFAYPDSRKLSERLKIVDVKKSKDSVNYFILK